mgnify:CR=1 FL=1
MTNDQTSLAKRIDELTCQVTQLSQRVAQLEKQTSLSTKPVRSEARSEKIANQDEGFTLADGTSLLASGSSLLKHVSAICFLLVIGLGLRALSDSGIISMLLGTILGIGYASLLIAGGYVLYRRAQSMAPLFTTTGAILMFSVLVETYVRFSSLPVEIVYLMMAITGISMALISFNQQVSLPIIVGTLGMCLTAVAIDYPNPFFPYLGLMLWLANVLGFFASRIKRCSWLRWLLMLTTHFMLQIWGLKITGVLGKAVDDHQFAPEWFIPIVTLIGFTFIMISFFGIIRSGNEKISKFDFMLPALNAAWCYVAGMYALKNPAIFGLPAAAAAILHFALAFWLARRARVNAPGTNTFTAGGVILAGLSLPALMGSATLPLPLLSLLALGICLYSNTWQSGGVRVTAYVLQLYVSIILVFQILGPVIDQPLPLFTVALICSWVAVAQYHYCRSTPPPAAATFFNRYDPHDLAALLPFFAGLASGLISCLALGYFILSRQYPDAFQIAYIGLQSLIINGSAIMLMVYAAMRQNRELRNVSFLILALGGVKVFVFDLLQISGSWLVAGIFTFGAATALQSIILARWKPDTTTSEQKQPSPEN